MYVKKEDTHTHGMSKRINLRDNSGTFNFEDFVQMSVNKNHEEILDV